jgi:hypothetical protein
MGAALLAALKALPELVAVVRQLGETYKQVQKEMVESKYAKLREEVNEITTQIENAKTNDERRALARKLNSAISR